VRDVLVVLAVMGCALPEAGRRGAGPTADDGEGGTSATGGTQGVGGLGGTDSEGGAGGSGAACAPIVRNGDFERMGLAGWEDYDAGSSIAIVAGGHESRNALELTVITAYAGVQQPGLGRQRLPDGCLAFRGFHRSTDETPPSMRARFQDPLGAGFYFDVTIPPSNPSWQMWSHECQPVDPGIVATEDMELALEAFEPTTVELDDITLDVCPCSADIDPCLQ
jgi:hypothetical protein